MQRFGAIVLLTVLLAGCGQAAAKTSSTPGAPQAKKGVPKIPHKITEGMVCKDCHGSGANGAPVSPHPDRENCTLCHQPK